MNQHQNHRDQRHRQQQQQPSQQRTIPVTVPPAQAHASSAMSLGAESAAAHSAISEHSDRLVSSLATERTNDGLCPTCGTRLYRLKKHGKMNRVGARLAGIGKKKPALDPRVDPETRLKRVPLNIEGEVMRGQCLRCTGGSGGALGTPGAHGLGNMHVATVALLQQNDTGTGTGIGIGSSGQPIATATAAAAADSDVPDAQYAQSFAMPALRGALPLPHATAAATGYDGTTMPVNVEYTGQYNADGQRHGEGQLRWENGDTYNGSFWNNHMDGDGTMNFADGTEYVGTWKLSKMEGQGTRRYANGNVYTGEYRSGKRSGQGRCYFANGDYYVGAWSNDCIEGFGRYHYNTGRAFEGNFKAGKREGRGKFQQLNGSVDIYRYVDDKRAGDGVRWSKDRSKAWRLDYKGKKKEKVPLERAMQIADRCGPVVDYSNG